MPATQPILLPGLAQFLLAVVAQGLQHPVPGRRPAGVIADQDRLVHQPGHHVKQLLDGQLFVGADSLDRVQLEPAGKHRQPGPQQPLRLGTKSKDHSTHPRNVCCRSGAARLPRDSRANRSVNRSRICAGASTRTRAAASSIANGNPSSRRHSSATIGALSLVRAKLGTTARARATNSATDSNRSTPARLTPGSGSGSDGTANSTSPGSSSGSRLVARTLSPGQRRSSVSVSTAPPAADARSCPTPAAPDGRPDTAPIAPPVTPPGLIPQPQRAHQQIGQHLRILHLHDQQLRRAQRGQIHKPDPVRESPPHFARGPHPPAGSSRCRPPRSTSPAGTRPAAASPRPAHADAPQNWSTPPAGSHRSSTPCAA